MQRRLFLVDAVSSIQTQGGTPKYVRYAKSIEFYFELFSNQAQGRIYPPIVNINYGYASTSDPNAQVDISFKITYYINLDTETLVIWVVFGACFFLSFIGAIIRTWIWNRRAGRLTLDLTTIFKFFMFIISYVANILFAILVCVCLFWLIFYKGQSVAFVVLPSANQQYSYYALIIASFIFKAIDVLHTILTQTSYDIFFIDWERPKSYGETLANVNLPTLKVEKNENKKDEAKEKLISEELREFNKVSCWRLLFVANEWNELQTFRKINTTIQLLVVLIFLKVVNLEAITTADCNTKVTVNPNAYQAPYSSILRLAMAAAMWIGCGKLDQPTFFTRHLNHIFLIFELNRYRSVFVLRVHLHEIL
jgi:meckelin